MDAYERQVEAARAFLENYYESTEDAPADDVVVENTGGGNICVYRSISDGNGNWATIVIGTDMLCTYPGCRGSVWLTQQVQPNDSFDLDCTDSLRRTCDFCYGEGEVPHPHKGTREIWGWRAETVPCPACRKTVEKE